MVSYTCSAPLNSDIEWAAVKAKLKEGKTNDISNRVSTGWSPDLQRMHESEPA